MSYSSVNYEAFGFINNVPANSWKEAKAGLPAVTFTANGKHWVFPFKTKKERESISKVTILIKNSDAKLFSLISDLSNLSKIKKELKKSYGFSNLIIDSLIKA